MIIVEPMDNSILRFDYSLVTMHTDHWLATKVLLSACDRGRGDRIINTPVGYTGWGLTLWNLAQIVREEPKFVVHLPGLQETSNS